MKNYKNIYILKDPSSPSMLMYANRLIKKEFGKYSIMKNKSFLEDITQDDLVSLEPIKTYITIINTRFIREHIKFHKLDFSKKFAMIDSIDQCIFLDRDNKTLYENVNIEETGLLVKIERIPCINKNYLDFNNNYRNDLIVGINRKNNRRFLIPTLKIIKTF